MVVKIVLTEEFIKSFGQCTEKKEYRKFYTDHRVFFENLFEKLELVAPSHNLDNKICSNPKFLLRYLWKWDRTTPFLHGDKPTKFEKEFSSFFDFLKTDISTNKWNILYSEYVFVADSLIKRARKQEIFDFQIEYNKKFYETFKARDTAKNGEMKTSLEYPDATEYDSSDSEDEEGDLSDEESEEESEDEIEDSDDDDSSSDDSEDHLEELVKEMSEKLDTVSTRLASLEETTATNKTPTNDSPIDLKTELVRISQVFTQGMAEFRATMSDFKTEINDKLEQMESRIKHGTSDSQEKIQSMKLEVETKITELDEKMNKRNEVLEGKIDEKLQVMKSKINLEIGKKSAELEEKMKEKNEGLFGKLENLAGLVEQDNETGSDSDGEHELELLENRDIDDPEPELHGNNDGANRNRYDDYDKDIREMEEEFQRALAEQNRVNEEKLRRAQERRREMNRAAEEEIRQMRNATNRGGAGGQ